MEIDAWVHFFGQVDPETENAVVGSLSCAGIKIKTLDSDALKGTGVVFFGDLNQGLCTFLREVSNIGRERVLAISISPSLVGDGGSWCLLEAGASDVFDWHHLPSAAEQVAARLQRWNVIDQIVSSPVVEKNLIGRSPVWKSILRQVVEIARFTDASVLITGESGTGKELVAHLIHTLDPRRQKRELVVVDCTTIVPELSGSEFYGHERGAFTGAASVRDGAFALADGGTLFLDEIGELPAGLQSQLLRVVQEHTYKRVGSNRWQHTDFRLVCATNKDLFQAVTEGEFRHDLYYRMANWVCKLPPLRERSEDILHLTRYFLRELQPGKEPPELDEPVRNYLFERDYPGNVRELKQLARLPLLAGY